MNRVELVEVIAEKHELTKVLAAEILETITQTITNTVKKNGVVQILGFGTFRQQTRVARMGYNPQLGKKVKLPATKVPKFVPGTKFKAAVDPRAAKRKASLR
jgi:DNA-binding protein HU-beta